MNVYMFLNDHNPELRWKDPQVQGEYFRFKFPNGYGASVIRDIYSYGGPTLWEIAVLDSNDRLVYDTPITDEVIGYVPEQDVSEYLYKIMDLPPRN